MKKLAKHLLIAGSVLTFAISCQCTHTHSNSRSSCPENNCQDNCDEDCDNGAYGDGDTSACCEEGLLNTAEPTEKTDLSNKHDPAPEPALSAASVEAAMESSASETAVVLEAVTPVEIIAEHQIVQDQNDTAQN